MKRIVGRTVKPPCSMSSSSCRTGTEDCGRAIRVSSASGAGAPHWSQKRLLGLIVDPQFVQRIAHRTPISLTEKRNVSSMIHKEPGYRNEKRGDSPSRARHLVSKKESL